MNPIFRYALDCGVKAKKPFVYTSFFPNDLNDYIIIEDNNLLKRYKYLEECVDYLRRFLKLEIIQIKINPTDQNIFGIKNYAGLKLDQFNYLIKNSKMVISNSQYTCDIARALGNKSIYIYSKLKPSNQNPYWYPDFSKNFYNEGFSEELALLIIKCFEEKPILEKLKPFFCGSNFNTKIIEVVPDHDFSESPIENQNLNIRADLHLDISSIEQILEKNKVNIITSKPISPKDINPTKLNNIIQINFEVNLNTKQEEIDEIKKFDTDIYFFSRDIKNISKIRLKFIDEIISEEKTTSKKDLDLKEEICDNTIYKSSKMIISNKKIYTSLSAYKKDIPYNPHNGEFEQVIDDQDFWAESEHIKLLKIIKNES